VKKQLSLSQAAFDHLLHWLHPDREMAGLKYEEIRSRLIKVLVRRNCNCAEELADETINRVTSKLDTIVPTYEGDPALYFYGVANHVFREWVKKKPLPLLPVIAVPLKDVDVDEDYERLEKCLEQLSPESRWLIVEYYQEEKGEKIDHRKALAEQLRITPDSLRMRAHRIKTALKKCLLDCLLRTKG
jgi:RNA polymerase sigma factor (sigma-70 family)